MKIKTLLILILILAVILSGCLSFSTNQPITEIPTLTPKITNTPEPTATPTMTTTPTQATTPTQSATATLTENEVKACPQILYDAMAESAERNWVYFPGINSADDKGGVVAIYYSISLGTINSEMTIDDGKHVDAVKMLMINMSPTTGKPEIRTYWQGLAYDYPLLPEIGYWTVAHFQYVDYDYDKVAVHVIDNYNLAVENGWTAEEPYRFWKRDSLVEQYSSGYYFVQNYYADESGVDANYKINPFRLIIDNAIEKDKWNFAYRYEQENGLLINKFFNNEPTPDDWINMIADIYRTEPISTLQTVPVDKVRTCLDSLK